MSDPPEVTRLPRRTHAAVLQSMRDRLFRQTIPADSIGPARRPLLQLKTREPSDPAIALLDAWACVMDVLTFYQERIINEGYLRSAITRGSVLELTRAIGYELHPSVAASVWLAFEVDNPPGALKIPAGSEVLSIPRQEQLPQTFETDTELSVESVWNRLRPAPPLNIEPLLPDAQSPGACFEGTDTGLGVGGMVLLVESGTGPKPWRLFKVHDVKEDRIAQTTMVAWSLVARGETESAGQPGIFAFRQDASLFGHDAPDWSLLPDTIKKQIDETGGTAAEWPNFNLDANTIDLDRIYARVIEGGWIVLVEESQQAPIVAPCSVDSVRTVARTDFMLRSKITRIVAALENPAPFGLRSTVVYIESAPLSLARVSVPSPIHGASVELTRTRPEPAPGQILIFVDESSARPERREAAIIQRVEAVENRDNVMRVILREELEGSYKPDSVSIYGNVVRATHGKTVREVLGSGDASQENQRFELRISPLTYVASPDEGAMKSTLSVRVGDVLWKEEPSLHGLGPTDACYTVRVNAAGVASVIFGDGNSGARLPSGQENVIATYRTGSGSIGNVGAGTLILLQTQRLGVRSVTNPIAASGGAAPDDIERARVVAPLDVCTMDRLVSLRDYESLALSFNGIDKATAIMLETDHGRILHLSIAGTDGQSIPRQSALFEALTQALEQGGDSMQPFQIDTCEMCPARLTATIRTDPRHRSEAVQSAVASALTRAFSFDPRAFGQPLSRSEIVAVMQRVAGVVSVDPIELRDADGHARTVIVPAPARFEKSVLRPAQLVILNLDATKNDLHAEVAI